jgi:hypothetical protein
MNESEFWRIIDLTTHAIRNDGNGEEQANLLVEYLVQLSEGDILDFDAIFRQYHGAANTYNLWDVTGIIEGGCGDDKFTDFRAGLIGRGQAIYESALADPESLVDVIEAGDYIGIEALNYVARKAYELKTGERDMPRRAVFPYKIHGEWTEEADLPTKFPKLYAKFTPFWDNYP